MKNIFSLAIAVFATVFFTSGAHASAKAAAAYKDVSIVEELSVEGSTYIPNPDEPPGGYLGSDCSDPTQEEIDAGNCILDPQFLTGSKYRILTTYIKAPHGKDLAIDVSLECGNFASVTSKGMGKSVKGSAAVYVAVVVTDKHGNVAFAEPKHDEGIPGVVFCKNSLELQATLPSLFAIGEPVTVFLVTEDNNGDGDLGLYVDACDTDETLGDDVCEEVTTVGTCLIQGENGEILADTACMDAAEISMMTGNMSANAFNYFYPNIQHSGVHKVEVFAWVEKQVDSKGKLAKGEVKATIGLGSMLVETIRMQKGLTGKDDSEVEECNFDNEAACNDLE
ncbi:MAG: hypothetical protein ACU833_09000 [Gammaproteobacteria bacterium]